MKQSGTLKKRQTTTGSMKKSTTYQLLKNQIQNLYRGSIHLLRGTTSSGVVLRSVLPAADACPRSF